MTKRKPKPRGKPFTGKDDPRSNPNGRPTKARETAKTFSECFIKLMHKEVVANTGGGQTVVAPNYEHFIGEMIQAGIKGGTGTQARKLVLSLKAIPLVVIVSAVSCGAPNSTIYTKLRRTPMSLR